MRVTTPQHKVPQYLLLAFILIVLAVIIALTARGIFSAIRVASEIDEQLLQNTTPHINQDQLDAVFNNLKTKTAPPLD